MYPKTEVTYEWVAQSMAWVLLEDRTNSLESDNLINRSEGTKILKNKPADLPIMG